MTYREAIKILKGTLSLIHQTNIVFDDVVNYREVSKMAIKALEKADKYRWIPCGEKMPEVDESCYTTNRYGETQELWWDGEWWHGDEFAYRKEYVIAWMPLPEAYKGDI